MIKGVDLTVMFGPGIPVPAPRAVVEALQSVSVQENSGLVQGQENAGPGHGQENSGQVQSGFDLMFALEKNSPLNTIFLLAGGAALPILRVALIITINGQATSLINGVVTHTELSPGTGGAPAMLKVMGKDLSATMEFFDFSGLPYPAMPPFARVALVLAKYAWLGVIPQVIPSLESPPLPTERIPRHQDSDLDYIRNLAAEAGYTFFMKPGPAPATSFAYWGPEVRIGETQPALTVESGSPTNAEELSFTFDKDGVEIPIVFIQNQLTKAPIPIPIPSAIPFHPPLGAIPPLPPKIKRLHGTARLNPFEAIVRGFAYAAQHADAVSGRGKIDVVRYGRVLKSRALVGVRGAGQAYDGLHYVDSVTHELKRGSYKQSFTLKRNGLLPVQASVPV